MVFFVRKLYGHDFIRLSQIPHTGIFFRYNPHHYNSPREPSRAASSNFALLPLTFFDHPVGHCFSVKFTFRSTQKQNTNNLHNKANHRVSRVNAHLWNVNYKLGGLFLYVCVNYFFHHTRKTLWPHDRRTPVFVLVLSFISERGIRFCECMCCIP